MHFFWLQISFDSTFPCPFMFSSLGFYDTTCPSSLRAGTGVQLLLSSVPNSCSAWALGLGPNPFPTFILSQHEFKAISISSDSSLLRDQTLISSCLLESLDGCLISNLTKTQFCPSFALLVFLHLSQWQSIHPIAHDQNLGVLCDVCIPHIQSIQKYQLLCLPDFTMETSFISLSPYYCLVQVTFLPA